MSAASTDPRGRLAAETIDGKGARTRRRLLDAAARLISERGIGGTTFSDIAQVSGLKAGSVYFHFDSKDRVLREVPCVGIKESLVHLHAALDAVGPDPTDRLAAAVRAHVGARSDLSDYAAVVLGVQGADLARIDGDFCVRRRDYLSRWLQLIHDAQATGALPADHDPTLIRHVLFGAMNCDLARRWTSALAADTMLALLGLGPTAASAEKPSPTGHRHEPDHDPDVGGNDDDPDGRERRAGP